MSEKDFYDLWHRRDLGITATEMDAGIGFPVVSAAPGGIILLGPLNGGPLSLTINDPQDNGPESVHAAYLYYSGGQNIRMGSFWIVPGTLDVNWS